MSFAAMVAGFSLVSIGFALGFFMLSRFIGRAVGASTLRTHRTIQQLYESGRVPATWITHASTEQERRKVLRKEIRRIESAVRRSPAFAEEGVRDEILEAVSSFHARLETDPISELVGPEMALRSTVVVLSPGVEQFILQSRRDRSALRTVERDGYRVLRLSEYREQPFGSLVERLSRERYRPIDTLLVARASESLISRANEAGFATVCFIGPGDPVESPQNADRTATDMSQIVACVREMESTDIE